MNGLIRKTLVLLSSTLFLLTAACTTIKPIYADEHATLAEKIQVGDRVRLTYIDDRVKVIDVTKVSETEISGTLHKATLSQRKGAPVVADWRDVYAAERVRISVLKTAGAAVGIVAAIPFLAIGVMVAGAGAY
ncbi:MAG: hypothetical protein IIB74_06925 [Proteobacteria bacterium]|nr:hypothetical protein [Pseudomonadota bacterium]